jgi:hypothetical protein
MQHCRRFLELVRPGCHLAALYHIAHVHAASSGRQHAAQPLIYGFGDRVSTASSLLSDLRVCVGTDPDSADTVRRPNEENHQAHQQNPARKHELCPTGARQPLLKEPGRSGNPRYETHRGRAPVLRAAVLTEIVNTAAIRMAYTDMYPWLMSRPYAKTSALALCPASIAS